MNIVICGVGGQGTVLASRLLAQAAMSEGAHVRTAETIGMAQRGGGVLGHVRIYPARDKALTENDLNAIFSESSDGTALRSTRNEVLSPLVPKGHADMVIGFEPGETVRALSYMKPGGTVICAREAVIPPGAALDKDSTYDGSAQLEYLKTLASDDAITRLSIIDGAAICDEVGSAKVLNVALLGAAVASGALPFDEDTMKAAIDKMVKPRFIEMNYKALELGIERGMI
ncbi:MAG: indolepyruvate oxidoreductase subunit beta [Coriobacteriales bacterium]|jgi:indolepyruvate ferredoxin oxidoreductase beta subunit|nr:indolepyruvate oxidoreductase subunit beta [Coriobacteriales bacterium]